MALVVQKAGGTTTASINTKPRQCWTCKLRREGLFGVDENGNPRCGDCCRLAGKPIDD